MSRATKRKYVTKEVLEEFVEPEGNQEIVKVLCGKGNNLHEVETADNRVFLVSMPTKFRRNVWIRYGSYVIVEPIAEGNKVKAEIIHILYKKQIASLKNEQKWPFPSDTSVPDVKSTATATCTANGTTKQDDHDNDESESSEDEDSDLFVNTNRRVFHYDSDSSTSSDD